MTAKKETVKSEMHVDASSPEVGSSVHSGWPGVFHDEVVKWGKDQVKEGGPKVSIQGNCSAPLIILRASHQCGHIAM